MIEKTGIQKVVCGENHTVLLTKEKTVYCWGNDESCQTGKNSEEREILNVNTDDYTEHLNPVKLSSVDVEDIFTGGNHSFLITIKDGKRRLKAWGNNSYGQLGNNSQDNSFIPVEVQFDEHVSILSATGGEDHSLALTEDKKVYSWGRNDDNQCGFLTRKEKTISEVSEEEKKKDFFLIPNLIDFFDREKTVTEIRATMHFNYAFNPETGKTFSWGLGENYVLGNRKYSNESVPYEIPQTFFKNLSPGDISLGSQHVVVALFDPATGIKRPTFEFDISAFAKKENDREERDIEKRKEPEMESEDKNEIHEPTPKKKTPFKMEIIENKPKTPTSSKGNTSHKKFVTTTPRKSSTDSKKMKSESAKKKQEENKMEVDEEERIKVDVIREEPEPEEKKEEEDKKEEENKMEIEEEETKEKQKESTKKGKTPKKEKTPAKKEKTSSKKAKTPAKKEEKVSEEEEDTLSQKESSVKKKQ